MESKTDLETFLDNVRSEIVRAQTKFPENKFLVAALSEETGELANALLEFEYGNRPAIGVYHEAIQVCAVAIRIALEGSDEFSYRFAEIDQTKNRVLFPDPDRQAKLNLLDALSEQTEFDRQFDAIVSAAEQVRDAWKAEGVSAYEIRGRISTYWPKLFGSIQAIVAAADAFERLSDSELAEVSRPQLEKAIQQAAAVCPRCGSKDPKLHPAMQFEGEVSPCLDPFHDLTKLNIPDADRPLLTSDGSNACLNCGRVLAAFSGIMDAIPADTPSGYTNGRFCDKECRNKFADRQATIDRVSGSFRPGIDDAKDPDSALHVAYYDGPDAPAGSRQCSNCRRTFTGPALIDAINTFCGDRCQAAFHLKTHDRQPPAVTLTPTLAKSVADLCNKGFCAYCNDPLPAIAFGGHFPKQGPKEFCCSDCLSAYAAELKQ